MSILAVARVDGIPGPKGSLNGFCMTCARRGLPHRVVMKEQSETGVKFREVVKNGMRVGALKLGAPYAGPIETHLTFYIHRRKQVRADVELIPWVPSHAGPYPTHRNSGDVEKHARTVHDALMDAGVIADDSQVWRVVAEKRWATAENPPGVRIEVLAS